MQYVSIHQSGLTGYFDRLLLLLSTISAVSCSLSGDGRSHEYFRCILQAAEKTAFPAILKGLF